MSNPASGYSWGTTTITGSPATISLTQAQVTITNPMSRDQGYFKIKKVFNPLTSGFNGTFDIVYNCGAGDVTIQLSADQTSSAIGPFDTGTSCSVSEPTLPTAPTGWTFGNAQVSGSPVTITKGDQAAAQLVTVTNTISRDQGKLTIVKKVVNDNGGTATVSAFGVNTSAGSITFDSGVANGATTTYTSQKITVVTGNYTLKENNVYGYTEGSWSCTDGTADPTTYNNGSVYVGKDKDVVCTITNDDDPGTVVIIKRAQPQQGTFTFTTTGSTSGPGTSWPSPSFTLNGDPTGDANKKTFTLDAGQYSVTESTQLGWVLMAIGGSDNAATPTDCKVEGSAGSTGTSVVADRKATINLKNGDTVTCIFDNTGVGATRTQGFWATHPEIAEAAWNGGPWATSPVAFPGVAAVMGDTKLCGRTITSTMLAGQNQVMGAFWSDIAKMSNAKKRSPLDQARMQLLQQLIAAELNASAFGSLPNGGVGTIQSWEDAFCGSNTTTIKNAMQAAASFNTSGDSQLFTPGIAANSKYGRSLADIKFWDKPVGP
jgi:hypothetical protein